MGAAILQRQDAPPLDQSTGEAAREALAARYADATPPVGEVWNDTLAGLLAHRSVRAYGPEPLPEGTLEALIAAAQSAASSSNLQTWSVVAVTDPARKARLAELVGDQAHVRAAPLFLVWIADLSRARRLADAASAPSASLEYLESFLVASIDAALAAQNAVVALESLGLGCVYIGAIRNKPVAVAQELGLPPLAAPVFGLCIGRPVEGSTAAVKPRLPQSVVLHREVYDARTEAAAIAGYDAASVAFQASQGLPRTGWSALVRRRVADPAQLSGRDRLRRALNSLGINLL
jgi:nitroreductase